MFAVLSRARKALRTAAVVASAGLVAACGAPMMSDLGGGGAGSGGPQIDPKQPVRVALLVPRSDSGAGTIARDLENAARLAIADLDGVNIDLAVYDTAGSPATAASAAQRAVADQIELPAGYSLSWSGQYEYMERAKERLSVVVPVTLAIIVLLLFLNFRRLVPVFLIMGTLPLALVGGLWLLDMLGYNMSVAVGVGFIALAGVAVEIGVLMIVYLEQALKDRQEQAAAENRSLTPEDLREAVVKGALLRVRPIMMTVAVVIAGLLPIMFGSGTGSEVMRRIAAPMVGGMTSATVLTLLVLPAAFLIWQRWRLRSEPEGDER